jgi:ubiquinone/menaquinone biosynthesis C-methylase UbiE
MRRRRTIATKNRSHDIQHFNRWSRTYERSWLQRVFFGPVHKAVLAMVAGESAPESILDVGCGTGRLLRRAGARWPAARLIGVDPAEGMIAEARRLTPGATFHLGTAEALPLPDASVDLAMSTLSFHHWRDGAAGLCEVARVLRPGGRFVLADFILPAWLRPFLGHAGSDRSPRPAAVRALFAQAGLEVCEQRRVRARHVLMTMGTRR